MTLCVTRVTNSLWPIWSYLAEDFFNLRLQMQITSLICSLLFQGNILYPMQIHVLGRYELFLLVSQYSFA